MGDTLCGKCIDGKTNIDNRIESNLDEKLHELVIGDTNGQKEDREPDTQNPGQGKRIIVICR